MRSFAGDTNMDPPNSPAQDSRTDLVFRQEDPNGQKGSIFTIVWFVTQSVGFCSIGIYDSPQTGSLKNHIDIQSQFSNSAD